MPIRRSGIGVPQPNDPRFLERVAELLRVWNGEGANALDRVLTLRDLVDGEDAYHVLRKAGGASGPLTEEIGGGEADTDRTPPPAPSNLTANGAFDAIILSWGFPDVNYSVYFEIWRHTSDLQGSATLIGTTQARVYTDQIDNGVQYFYWVRAVRPADPPIVGPFNASAGTPGQVGTDPSYVLGVLTGQVSESELVQSLNNRIDLIDTPGTGLVDRVTVNEGDIQANANAISAVQATAGENSVAIATEQSVRAQALAPDFNELTAYAVGDTVVYNNQLYRANTANGPGAWNAAYWDLASNVYGQWTIKVDANGKVVGIGLANDGPGNASDDFVVVADRFAVIKPDGTGQTIPFIVDAGSGLVVIDTAAIGDASITNAKIQNLSADKLFVASGTIAEAIIGSGHITNAMIDNIIQSNNYSAGVSGWRINKDGTAEFRDITARGDIEASSLKANTAMVGSAHIQDAAITSAKVGNLQIQTDHLNYQAVTIPLGAGGGSVGSVTYPNWGTGQQLTINSTGNPHSIHVFCRAGGNYNPYGSVDVNVRVYCSDGTTWGPFLIASGDDGGGGMYGSVGGLFAFVTHRTVSAGSYTYYLQIQGHGGGTYISDGTIVILETKR